MRSFALVLALFAFIGLLIASPTPELVEKRSLFVRTSSGSVTPVANEGTSAAHAEPPAVNGETSAAHGVTPAANAEPPVPGSPSSVNSFGSSTLHGSDASDTGPAQQPGAAIAPFNYQGNTQSHGTNLAPPTDCQETALQAEQCLMYSGIIVGACLGGGGLATAAGTACCSGMATCTTMSAAVGGGGAGLGLAMVGGSKAMVCCITHQRAAAAAANAGTELVTQQPQPAPAMDATPVTSPLPVANVKRALRRLS